MTNPLAQFEASLLKALAEGEEQHAKEPPEKVTSISSVLQKDDQFLFGPGTSSNLIVVECDVCSALIKPAFIAHHRRKIHGADSNDPNVRYQPLVHKQVINVKNSSVKSPKKSKEPIKVKIKKYPTPPVYPTVSEYTDIASAVAKCSGPKKKETKKTKKKEDKKKESIKKQTLKTEPKTSKKDSPKVDHKASIMSHLQTNADMMNFALTDLTDSTLIYNDTSPPPSPPSLYPSTSPSPVTNSPLEEKKVFSKVKRRLSLDEIKDENVIEVPQRNGYFDFLKLAAELPQISKEAYYRRDESKTEVTREVKNGFTYQHQAPRPLAYSHYGGRSIGAGQVVYTRNSDHLRAALQALLPAARVDKCTSELRPAQKKRPTLSQKLEDHQRETRGPRKHFSSCSRSPPPSPDPSLPQTPYSLKSPLENDKFSPFDAFNSDRFEAFEKFANAQRGKQSPALKDTLLQEAFNLYEYDGQKQLASKLFNRANIPKLKVDPNHKSASAMAVFEFDDPEDTRKAREEERLRMLRAGVAPLRKNKRKLVKTPPLSLTPKTNGSPNISPSSPILPKRGKFEVIDLDKTPPTSTSPSMSPNTSPLRQFVSSPRHFTFMLGYSEQSAT